MKRRYVVAGLCALLAVAAPRLQAQAAHAGHGRDSAAVKGGAKAGSNEMATHHAQMQRLQKSAITAATQAEKLAHGKRPARKAILAHATRARSDLKAVLNHLDAAEKNAGDQEKQVIAQVRTHDQEAVKHADELIEAAKKPGSTGEELDTHAKALLEHAQAAQAVVASHGTH